MAKEETKTGGWLWVMRALVMEMEGMAGKVRLLWQLPEDPLFLRSLKLALTGFVCHEDQKW